jgi:CRP/FNR family transcriptional regulator
LSHSSKEEALKRTVLFSDLSQSELGELVKLTSERSYEVGEYVFWEGDSGDYLYTVGEGRIKVSKLSSQGKEVIIAFFSPGEMFGEVALFEGKAYPASAQAATAARVLAIRRQDFLKLLTKHPQIALVIIGVLSGRLREAQWRLKDLALERVDQRLARVLLMLSAKLGETLPFTRQEIADMAGTTTETTIRFISRLKEGKIISSDRGKLVILNKTKLELIGEGPPKI